MNLNYETTIHLSEEDIKNIIIQHLKLNKKLDTLNITFDITKQMLGYGPTEFYNFKGATIRVNKVEKVPMSINNFCGD